MPVHVAAPPSATAMLSTMPSVSTAPSSSAHSSSPALQYAAMNGMFVKLHVKDGCGQAVDIPVKNLLRVNARKESLSNEASYSILRHCALSQLFRFEPNQEIPTYAWKNFLTRFSYETNQHAHGQIVRYNINNNSELTEALEVAASIHLIELDEFETITDIPCSSNSSDDIVKKSKSSSNNKNIIILEIHCEFINRRNVKNIPRQRKDPTIAAEHVVKTLHEWIQKASAFVVDIVGDFEQRDYVVVRSGNVDVDGSGDAAGGKKKVIIEDKDEEKEKRNQNQPIEWAKRFIQVLLVPERETKDLPVMVEHVHCSPPCKGFSKGEQQAQQPNLLDEYEESLEVLTASFVEGLKKTSKFIHRVVKDHQEKAKKRNRLNCNNDEEDNLSLSASPTPSLVKSVASISSSSSIEEVVVEHGIEIVFEPNNQNKSVSNNGDKDEWKIFFGESKEEEEAVMISNPCEEEVISLASSEHKDYSSAASSFEQISEAKGKDADDDEVSWAMLSDDE